MRGSGRTNKKQKEDWPEQWNKRILLYLSLTGTHTQTNKINGGDIFDLLSCLELLLMNYSTDTDILRCGIAYISEYSYMVVYTVYTLTLHYQNTAVHFSILNNLMKPNI